MLEKTEITFAHEVVERKLFKEEKSTKPATKGSHEIGGNHGNMPGRFLEPACDLRVWKASYEILPLPNMVSHWKTLS